MRKKESRTPLEILEYIKSVARVGNKNFGQCTFLIDGRSGPTGKTWLCNKLNEAGFEAHEVGEELWPFYIHRDKKNHCERLPGNVVLVILNEYLPEDIVRGSFKTNE